MVVHSGESQGGPGELQGLEVEGGAGGPRALDAGLVSRPLRGGGGAVENPHGVKGEAVQDLNAAVMKGQSETLDPEHRGRVRTEANPDRSTFC